MVHSRQGRVITEAGVSIPVFDGGDIADDAVVHDTHGRVIDDDYVDRAVAEVRRRRGRPSLSGRSGVSRAVQIRFDEQTHESVREAARAAGVSASEWVRQAVRERLDHAS
jgi:hypothetical protein